MDLIIVNEKDNIATLLKDCMKGSIINGITLLDNINKGHKIAIKDIIKGEGVIKYGEYIGIANINIKKGSHVHIHNMDGIRGRGDKKGCANDKYE